MSNLYHNLQEHRPNNDLGYVSPEFEAQQMIDQSSPATMVMTDFNQRQAFTIFSNNTIDEANSKMMTNKIRALLVTSNQGTVKGLITSMDILGEKPMTVVQSRGVRHDEILVEDVMVDNEHLLFLTIEQIQKAQVGDIVVTLKQAGRQHALIIEKTGQQEKIRGIISASQIARQLGITETFDHLSKTFEEIEKALR